MNSSALETSVGIVTINAQYAHTHPGIRILRNIAHDLGLSDAWIQEFTLSDPVWKMAEIIAKRKPKILGISISIWNRDASLMLARRIKSILPNTRIVAGGPEVWFEAGPLEGIDAIIPGEAEQAWHKILCHEFSLQEEKPAEIVEPYRDIDLAQIKGRMVYLETSRGCPFQCAFCQSGRKDARHKQWGQSSPATLAETVAKLTQAGAHTIKFLDRTFNAQAEKALAYFKALAAVDKAVCHFEICAELLDDDTLAFLGSLPPGKFQFEIGVQSLNPQTLKSIGRRTDTHLLMEKLRALLSLKTVHVHADLIWGLPHDTLPTIVEAFNTLYSLGLDELQLGFLKFLRGAPLNKHRNTYGYTVEPSPPYEALSHKDLSGEEFLQLRRVEYVFNRFHNSKRFPRTLPYLLKSENLTPYALFEKIANTFSEKNLFIPALTTEKQCEILHSIFKENPLLLDHMRLDYTCSQKVFTLPKILSTPGIKIPPAQQKRDTHTLHIALEHQLETQTQEIQNIQKTAIYKITHHHSVGYYNNVTIEEMSNISEK
jgi:radical SAM superfamily enzyme YgiQ (UPF0313 family)